MRKVLTRTHTNIYLVVISRRQKKNNTRLCAHTNQHGTRKRAPCCSYLLLLLLLFFPLYYNYYLLSCFVLCFVVVSLRTHFVVILPVRTTYHPDNNRDPIAWHGGLKTFNARWTKRVG